jgi:hypothetical protein
VFIVQNSLLLGGSHKTLASVPDVNMQPKITISDKPSVKYNIQILEHIKDRARYIIIYY